MRLGDDVRFCRSGGAAENKCWMLLVVSILI